MKVISFQRDSSKQGCPCEENPEQEDFIYLCRKCGGGYVFKNDAWVKVFRFDQEALNELLLILNS